MNKVSLPRLVQQLCLAELHFLTSGLSSSPTCIRDPLSGERSWVSSAIENPTFLHGAKRRSQFPGLIRSKSPGLTGFNPALAERLRAALTGGVARAPPGSVSLPGATGPVKRCSQKRPVKHPTLRRQGQVSHLLVKSWRGSIRNPTGTSLLSPEGHRGWFQWFSLGCPGEIFNRAEMPVRARCI